MHSRKLGSPVVLVVIVGGSRLADAQTVTVDWKVKAIKPEAHCIEVVDAPVLEKFEPCSVWIEQFGR